MIRICKEREIHSVDDWFALAPPKQPVKQWVDGRSAKELAKAWFPSPGIPQVPPELNALTESRQETRHIVWERGEPERVTTFDACGGEGRNADLVFWERGPHGTVLASIEAKADESFGEIAGEYTQQSIARNPQSRVPERFALLCGGVLGTGPDDKQVLALRYQLLTAVAGALVEAEKHGADIVLFIVHEFVRRTDAEKVKANAADLNRFVTLVSRGAISSVSPGQLVGPVSVPGNEHFRGSESLFIGKCRAE